MTSPQRRLVRRSVLASALLLGVSACSSSDSSSDAPADTSAASSEPEAEADSDPETNSDPEAEPEAPSEPEPTPDAETEPVPDAAPAGGGDVSVALSDGQAWTLNGTFCAFDADATGPAAAILNVAGNDDDGAEVNLLDAWPLDGSTDNGPVFFGNFVDADENLYIFVNGSSSMTGGLVEVTADYYTNVFYEDGDTPDGSAVITCQP